MISFGGGGLASGQRTGLPAFILSIGLISTELAEIRTERGSVFYFKTRGVCPGTLLESLKL